MVAGLTHAPSGAMPSRSQTCANRARSLPVENTPAWPATPPKATAFWSFTRPGTGWPRQMPLGAIRALERPAA